MLDCQFTVLSGEWQRELMPKPFGLTWFTHRPDAHPIWDTYIMFVYDLVTPRHDIPPPVLYAPGVTHEMMLCALDPAKGPYPETPEPIRDGHFLEDNGYNRGILSPPNYAYQFVAMDHQAAENRMQMLYVGIMNKTINPDTDHRRYWNNEVFWDGFSLMKGENMGPINAD